MITNDTLVQSTVDKLSQIVFNLQMLFQTRMKVICSCMQIAENDHVPSSFSGLAENLLTSTSNKERQYSPSDCLSLSDVSPYDLR